LNHDTGTCPQKAKKNPFIGFRSRFSSLELPPWVAPKYQNKASKQGIIPLFEFKISNLSVVGMRANIPS
jgi:hypothetical protein